MAEEYKGKNIIVRWDTIKCVHSGRCVKGLSAVFDVKKKPWVNPDAASAEEVRQAIKRCPSGALSYEDVK